MRYLSLAEIIELHRLSTETSGGATGIRDLGALESAVAQPKATFDMIDLYPSVADKAAVLCFSIVQNHPFVDGNKRTGLIVKAHVREGRLVVDEPTDLPEGTEIDLLPLDPGDWLDEADRAALHEALRQSDADVAAGRLVDAEEILKELRSR